MDYEEQAEMIDRQIANSLDRIYEDISREFISISLKRAILKEIEWLRS